MKLTFWGAARTVTGSMHQLNVNGRDYLLDCGLFQGRRKEAAERNTKFPFNPSAIDAVLLSHAHIDHTGNLPNLVKNGFTGPIYTSAATIDLCRPMLTDSAHLQESDAEFLNRRKQRRNRLGELDESEIVEPLYTQEDADKTFPLFQPVEYHKSKEIAPGMSYRTLEAGHMLGSTAMVIDANGIKLAFSGDVGRKGLPIIRDPETMPQADYLIMESTYGDRLHQSEEPVRKKLADTIRRTYARGGRVIVPAFAVGRTQQLIVLMHELIKENLIPAVPVFVDSPLAVNATEVFRKHSECYDAELKKFFEDGDDPFGFFRLRYIRDVKDSKALNDLRGPYMVISASGMCEAGRILHHLKNNIGDPRNTVLITGFQAEHTLGRKIVDKQPEVNIFGEPYRLRAEVVKINELSGHADQRELIEWMRPIMPRVKKVFLVHGEIGPQEALASVIRATYPKAEVVIPSRGESHELV
jgi:metallo-beta-lactamase family protein